MIELTDDDFKCNFEDTILFLKIECSVERPFEQMKQQILKSQEDSKKLEKIKKLIDDEFNYKVVNLVNEIEEILNEDSEDNK